MKEFKQVDTFGKGEILARGNERVIKTPGRTDFKYQFLDITKKVGVAALSAVIESQRVFRVDYTDFEDGTNNTLLGS